MRSTSTVCLLTAAMCGLSGCASYDIRYHPFVRNIIAPADSAAIVEGDFREASSLFQQAQLPHNTLREQYELQRQAVLLLTDQLGSPDYVLIGQIRGHGNGEATPEMLDAELQRRAAAAGGDVILIIEGGVEEQPFVYRTPSYTRTRVYGYWRGPYGWGPQYYDTSFYPGNVYSGVYRFPHAGGLVFKYLPAVEQRRQRLDALDDNALEQVLVELDRLHQDDQLRIEDILQRWDELLDQYGARGSASS